jgi:pantothenate kinase
MCCYFLYEIIESDRQSTVQYTKKTVQESFIPLINTIIHHYEKSQTKPYTLALAGPPGCGKSAVSSIFKILLEAQGIVTYVLPLDGFHFNDEELKKMKTMRRNRPIALYERKGAKETYRVEHLVDLLAVLKSGQNLHWPIYSRSTHNPVEKGIFINNKDAIYIVEGNYLLLDCNPWNTLRKYFNRKIFISSKKRFLRKRIRQRKKKGGFSSAYARRHYRECDSENIDEVMTSSSGYDFLLTQRGAHRYTFSSL